MTKRRGLLGKTRLISLFAILVQPVFLLLAYLYLFTGFSLEDDEGYILLTIKSFLAGKSLYSHVYTQYGPAFYIVSQIFSGIFHIPVSHDAYRIISIVYWYLTSIGSALVVFRISRSMSIALFAQFAVFFIIRKLAGEPPHPQAICIFLIAISFLLALRCTPTASFFLGVSLSLLSLIKINIGAFMCFAYCLAWIALVPKNKYLGIFYGLAIMAAIFFPFALMRAKLGTFHFIVYSATVSLGLLFVFTSIKKLAKLDFKLEFPSWMLGGFILTTFGCLLYTWSRGTEPHWILYGLLLQHLGFEKGFTLLHPPLVNVWLLGANILLYAAYAFFANRSGTKEDKTCRICRAVLKLLPAFLLVFTTLLLKLKIVPPLNLTAALAWILLVPVSQKNGDKSAPDHLFIRAFIAFASLLTSLWAFPVEGTQEGFSTMVSCICAAICLRDACLIVGRRSVLTSGWFKISNLAPTLVLAGLLSMTLNIIPRYNSYVAVRLPGTTLVKVPQARAQAFEKISRYLRENSDTFFGMPGLNSFYLWTDKEPPTEQNLGAWMTLLPEGSQLDIQHCLEKAKSPFVVINEEDFIFWDRGVLPANNSTLVRYIRSNFEPVWELDGYQVCKRKAEPKL